LKVLITAHLSLVLFASKESSVLDIKQYIPLKIIKYYRNTDHTEVAIYDIFPLETIKLQGKEKLTIITGEFVTLLKVPPQKLLETNEDNSPQPQLTTTG